jgi:rhodanese-related sulfurtransferase
MKVKAMRNFGRILIVLIALASTNAWSDIRSKQEIAEEAKAKAPHISAQELAGYLAAEKEFVLLDIRTEAEYEAGHIRGALWLPRGKLEYEIQDVAKNPDARIVLYCRTGGRSALATLTLLGMGYTDVADLDGGFEEWVTQGNTFYNQDGELKVVEYQKKE